MKTTDETAKIGKAHVEFLQAIDQSIDLSMFFAEHYNEPKLLKAWLPINLPEEAQSYTFGNIDRNAFHAQIVFSRLRAKAIALPSKILADWLDGMKDTEEQSKAITINLISEGDQDE